MDSVLEVLAETGAPAADPLDAEHELLGLHQMLGPPLQRRVSRGAGWERALAKELPELIEHHRVVALFVGVNADCDHRVLLIVWHDLCDVEATGQSCVE